MNTFELNNARRDADVSGVFTKTSPVVEIFSALVKGEDLSRFGAKADKAVNYIKELGVKAENGDFGAISELNTLRRIAIEAPVMEEMKLLGIFGSYQNVGFDESIEREVHNHVGEMGREQAANGDVVFPAIHRETYPVPTFTVSGGYVVDYRRVAVGDMSKENEGMELVKKTILNKAMAACVKKVYDALYAANGVKYNFEGAQLTKTGVDAVINGVRRFGKPSVIADYALLSQFTPWAGYVGTSNVLGISEKAMEEIRQNGMLASYNGAKLVEMANPYDMYAPLKNGNFQTMLPAGLGFVVPAGAKSPIATYTRGGLTSLTGNDVKTGHIMTRFDIEVGCDVAKGQEHMIGTIYDATVGGLDITLPRA